jgi:stage II sporulation protein M
MKKVLDCYRQEWRFFRERHLRTFLFLSVLFIVAIVVSLFYFRLHPNAALKQIDDLAAMSGGFDRMTGQAQFLELILILAKNLMAAFFTLILGLIPFFLFPLLPLLSNGYILAACIHWGGKISFLTLTAGILPHGIFEFPAIIYAACLGVGLSLRRTKNRNVMLAVDVHQQKPEHDLPFSQALKSFALIVIPLFFLAALIETFITPLFLSAAMK